MQAMTTLIRDALRLPDDALKYELSLWMRQVFPGKHILETEDYDFDLKAFVAAGRCRARLLDCAHPQLEAKWSGRELGGTISPHNAFQEIRWNGRRLTVLTLTYGSCDTKRHWLVTERAEDAREFFARFCAFSSEVHGEILVFKNGWWIKDKALLEQISKATLDGLILPNALLETLKSDFEASSPRAKLMRASGCRGSAAF